MYSFIRVGASVPKLQVANCIYNKNEIITLIESAAEKKVKVLTFPELCITSYTCGDLFFQSTLLQAAEKVLGEIAEITKNLDMFLVLGLPITADKIGRAHV